MIVGHLIRTHLSTWNLWCDDPMVYVKIRPGIVSEHVNNYSIIRIIRRPVLWKDFAVYDLVVIPLRQRYCKLHVWLKLDLYVKDGSWVNLGISIGLDWFIWRPITTQVTEPNDQWQLIITSFRTRYGIDVGVRHILVLDISGTLRDWVDLWHSERSGAVDGGIASAHTWTLCQTRSSVCLEDLCSQNGQV